MSEKKKITTGWILPTWPTPVAVLQIEGESKLMVVSITKVENAPEEACSAVEDTGRDAAGSE